MTPKAQREAAALRRLKQRIARELDWMQGQPRCVHARFINEAIDAWAAAERKRGER